MIGQDAIVNCYMIGQDAIVNCYMIGQDAIVNFSMYLGIGNMDEAFKELCT